MRVEISRRAARRAEQADRWWRENRPVAPDLFAEELRDAFALLSVNDCVGTPVPTERRPTLRRLLLEKTHVHVYFDCDDARTRIRVVTVWGAVRGRAPRL